MSWDECGKRESGVISPNFGAAPPASGSYLACSTKDEWQQQSSFLRSKISIEIAEREKHSYFYKQRCLEGGLAIMTRHIFNELGGNVAVAIAVS